MQKSLFRIRNFLPFPFLSALFLINGLIPFNSFALSGYDPGNLLNVTSGTVDSLLKTVATGASHRAYMPASPLGISGFDLGVEVTMIGLPDEFKSAFSLATGQATDQLPSSVPLPRFHVHKGFPGNIDFGLSYFSFQDIFKAFGGDLKWTFLKNPATPSVAARISGGYSKLWFIGTHNYSFDVLASKDLVFIEPYVGTGLQFWSGDLNVPINVPGGLSASVSATASGTTGHFFVGLPIKMLLFRITPEFDYVFTGMTVYGVKMSLGF